MCENNDSRTIKTFIAFVITMFCAGFCLCGILNGISICMIGMMIVVMAFVIEGWIIQDCLVERYYDQLY